MELFTARAAFTRHVGDKLIARLTLHAVDEVILGDMRSKEYQALKKLINVSFNDEHWQEIVTGVHVYGLGGHRYHIDGYIHM